MTQTMMSPSRTRRETRLCKHPGCAKKFEGSPTSLYCPEHRTRKSRAERFVPKQVIAPEENNLVFQTIPSTQSTPVQKTMACALAQCGRHYTFSVYSDHSVYPMYCELHRTEYKRRFFLRMASQGKQITYEKPQIQKWSDCEMQFEDYALQQQPLDSFLARKPKGARPQ
jgi:hypothetical protein